MHEAVKRIEGRGMYNIAAVYWCLLCVTTPRGLFYMSSGLAAAVEHSLGQLCERLHVEPISDFHGIVWK